MRMEFSVPVPLSFAVTCTIFLSLDTTAALLTPVALSVANQIGVPPRPFALTTLWIANTGSLLLPVSNLTNLLALQRLEALGVDHTAYVRLAFAPAIVSIAITLGVIALLHWRAIWARAMRWTHRPIRMTQPCFAARPSYA